MEITTGDGQDHDCVNVLQKLVAIQHEKISNLENELHDLANCFGEREQALLRQIARLHGEIQNQALVFRQIFEGYKISGAQEKVPEETKDEINNKDGVITCDTDSDLPNKNSEVNGRDMSQATHEETLEAFSSSNEPILVEVLRRSSKAYIKPTPKIEGTSLLPQSTAYCDTYCQTDWSGGWEGNPIGLFPFGQTSLIQSSSPQMALLTSDVLGNHFNAMVTENDLAEDDGDIEYEEITLHRSNSNEKLGLTLCYGAPEDVDTDIFVSEIEPDSTAAKDGRIQEGDQLLQINGTEVRNREQAVLLFSEKRTDFTLLVARPNLQGEDYLLEDSPAEVCPTYSVLLEQDEDDVTTDTGITENTSNRHEKDSGVGRTDESTRNDESSEHEVGENGSNCGDLDKVGEREVGSYKDSDSSTEDSDKLLQREIVRLQEELANSDNAALNNCPVIRHYQSDISLDREMALLNKEMENIQIECESLVNRHLEDQHRIRVQLDHVYVNLMDLRKNSKSPNSQDKKENVERWVNSMVCNNKQSLIQTRNSSGEERDSSSAYNTADSSGSVPLTLELSPLPTITRDGEIYGSVMSLVSPRMEDKGTQLQESDVASIFSCESCRRCCKSFIQSDHESTKCTSLPPSSSTKNSNKKRTNTSKSGSDKESTLKRYRDRVYQERNRNYVSFHPCNTMYTNHANLEHTIWLQQQMFQQAIIHQKPKDNKSKPPSYPGGNKRGLLPRLTNNKFPFPGGGGYNYSSSPSKSGLSTVREDEEIKMEWKVKRRADGTRYITRRPVRNKLLKARAMKIMEERCGITTDDDAMSELKIGRYWTKEERKRHLECARDRKKKEIILKNKMTNAKEQMDDNDDMKKEMNILELAHKKMMRRRGKIVFDDFTTVQEVLVHGTKGQAQGAKPLGLLSVTTV